MLLRIANLTEVGRGNKIPRRDVQNCEFGTRATCKVLKEGKAIPVTGRQAHRVVRRRGCHIFQTVGSQMAVRSALRAGHPLPLQEDSWYPFLLEAESTPGS
jgi:hypothetical protein